MGQDLKTECIAMARTFDGRLQVSGKKVRPHVIYCRLWRFPQLQYNHELQPIEDCPFTFNLKREQVCVNPYHYTKVHRPMPRPVTIPRTGQLEIPIELPDL